MNEADWKVCVDPAQMLLFAEARLTDRQRRLFVCAGCRRAWHYLNEERLRQAIEVAERYADHLADETDLDLVRIAVNKLERRDRGYGAAGLILHALAPPDPATYYGSLRHSVHNLPWALMALLPRISPAENENAILCDLLRDIAGNPFQETTSAGWRTSTVWTLAQAAADERVLPEGHLDPVRLAVLADAVEEAGCTDSVLLEHLRGPGPHVLGCWAVDLLAGKE
jgi:hypothetical protein